MRKDDLILTIRNAKAAHKRWVENARSLIEGLPLDKSQVPINSTDCQFGQWYYGEGQSFKPLPSYRDIETHHDGLHKTYREIFVLLFSEEDAKPSMLSRLFGTAQKSSKERQEAAKSKFNVLEQQSVTIAKKLDDLEAMIAGMSPEQIDSYLFKEKK